MRLGRTQDEASPPVGKEGMKERDMGVGGEIKG